MKPLQNPIELPGNTISETVMPLYHTEIGLYQADAKNPTRKCNCSTRESFCNGRECKISHGNAIVPGAMAFPPLTAPFRQGNRNSAGNNTKSTAYE